MDLKSRRASVMMLALLLGTLPSVTFRLSTVNSLDSIVRTHVDGSTDPSINRSRWVKLVTGDVVVVSHLSNRQRPSTLPALTRQERVVF